MRHGSFADAHPPRKNLIFQEKCWKGVPKSSPESTFSRKHLLKPTRELNPRKSRFCCFSRSRMVAAISRRVFRCVDKVIVYASRIPPTQLNAFKSSQNHFNSFQNPFVFSDHILSTQAWHKHKHKLANQRPSIKNTPHNVQI